MLNQNYGSMEELRRDFSEEEIVARVNQFHSERNRRMEHNKDYQRRQRVLLRELKAQVGALRVDVNSDSSSGEVEA